MDKIGMIVLLSVLVLLGAPGFAQNTTSNNNAADLQRMMRARYGAMGGSAGAFSASLRRSRGLF